jgi:hypothetical protein
MYYSDAISDALARSQQAMALNQQALSTFDSQNPDPGALPQVKEGATDATVEEATGIKGLISLITKTLEAKGFLNIWGSTLSPSVITKVKEFQAAMGLNPDGVIGPRTYTALFGTRYKYVSPSYVKKLIPIDTDAPVETGGVSWVDWAILAAAAAPAIGFYIWYRSGQEK